MEIHKIKSLIQYYGEDATLGEVLREIQGNKVHECPKCNGSGKINRPTFHDGGLSRIDHFVMCDLCNGDGYTEHEYKPKMEQVGWE